MIHKEILKERFVKYYYWLIENKKITNQEDLAKKIGVSKNTISRLMTGKTVPNVDTISKLTNTFEDSVNKMYLRGFPEHLIIPRSKADKDLFGDTGYKESPSGEPSEQDIPKQSYKNGRPYYNVDFRCGFDILINCQTQNPDYLIDFQPYNDCDLYCNAHGDSMHPTISSGDIVALKRIEDFRYLINGEIYAIVTSNGMRTIKRIRDNGDTFTLIADNQAISDQTIPKSLVTHAFLVRGSIKMF